MKQEDVSPEAQAADCKQKIEYTYSMKDFETQEIINEREPHRIIEIQDPILYRGELGYQKSNVWRDTHQVFIVNGKLEKVDGNFQGGFFFNKVKDTRVILGTFPLTQKDLNQIQEIGATAVINLQTGQEMAARGVFWPVMKAKYLELGIQSYSFPLPDKNEQDYADEIFNICQHLNDLVNEQGHTVFLQDNSAISRGPTVLMSYMVLYAKFRQLKNLPDLVRMIQADNPMSLPNIKMVQKLLKEHTHFRRRQLAYF